MIIVKHLVLSMHDDVTSGIPWGVSQKMSIFKHFTQTLSFCKNLTQVHYTHTTIKQEPNSQEAWKVLHFTKKTKSSQVTGEYLDLKLFN